MVQIFDLILSHINHSKIRKAFTSIKWINLIEILKSSLHIINKLHRYIYLVSKTKLEIDWISEFTFLYPIELQYILENKRPFKLTRSLFVVTENAWHLKRKRNSVMLRFPKQNILLENRDFYKKCIFYFRKKMDTFFLV